MSRISKKFAELQKKKEKALIAFITAGDPSFAANAALVKSFEAEGVDVIELGVPFSDPLADGPVIQASSQRALAKGATLAKILGLAKTIRQNSEIPLVLMSYLNPIFSYGTERFARDAAKAGVDGVILPDVPVEEGRELSGIFKKNKLDLIYLLAPTSTAARRKKVAQASSGFLYFVSMTGVTGSASTAAASVKSDVRAVKGVTKLPVCVGFGISTPDQAREMSKISDGVIVGSAIVRALAENPRMAPAAFAAKFVRPLARAVKGAR